MKHTFTFPPKPNGDNAVEISAFYQKGGMNWFNGKTESGGFYISFHTGCLKRDHWGESFTYMMFDGFKVKVADGSRDNKKKCAALLERVTEEIALLAYEDNQKGCYDALKQLFSPELAS